MREEFDIKQTAKQREEHFADQMKNQMMWNVAESNNNEKKDALSKNLELALLSRVLGIKSIEGQF
jgi:hypothetical protein